jgi:hypothetical protein
MAGQALRWRFIRFSIVDDVNEHDLFVRCRDLKIFTPPFRRCLPIEWLCRNDCVSIELTGEGGANAAPQQIGWHWLETFRASLIFDVLLTTAYPQ